MTMGHTGMGGMGEHMVHMGVPENSIPMVGGPGPFAYIDMGGMFTVLKVRREVDGYNDPGWYDHPAGTVAGVASADALRRDGIDLSAFRAEPSTPTPPAQLHLDEQHGGHGAHGAASTAPEAGATYTCPHHPEVVSDKPGICPKCRMKLTAKK
jgi:hypothetical protein